MVIYFRVSGRTIRLMDMEFIIIKMGQDIRASGKMIFRMEKDRKLGWIIVNMREIIKWDKKTVKGNIPGAMVRGIRGIGLIII